MWKAKMGQHKVGSTDLCGRSTPCGTTPLLSRGVCHVGPQVDSRCPLGFEAVCLPVGPSIHVMSPCRPLIRWVLPPLDW
jgi:hypothetical protein